MKVILIKDDFGYEVGIVSNVNRIIDFLIEKEHLSGASTIYEEDGIETTVLEMFGEFWEEFLRACNLKELRYHFSGIYLFNEYEVYE